MKITPIVALATMFAAACGGAAIPADKLAQSQAAVRSAQETGAASHPASALHLKLAQEQLVHGKKLIQANENERAEYVLGRAKADAELAMNLAREAKVKEEAKSTLESINKAKSSMQEVK